MIDWDDLRYFLAVQRGGTLARAARALRINATTVGRRLGALEERVGAKLFERTPEGYVLTRAGHELLARAERMEGEALALERAISGTDRKLAGVVRLSATEMLGTRFIAPHLARFASEYPELTLELSCTNRPVNLRRREADIALRLAQPKEDDLVIKRLAEIPLSLYASRGYLGKHGTPPKPDTSLAGHAAILFADSPSFALENGWYAPRLAGARVVMRSDSVSSIFSAVVAGLGIALLPRVVAEAEPALIRLDTRDAPEPRVVWRAVHRDLARAPRIRAVMDFLGEIVLPARRPRSHEG
jgi:DNA-binding transcriptional LysR family regulator